MGGAMANRLPPNIRNNNGSLSFQKRIPEAVIGHPYWNGKKFFTKQLGLPEKAFYEDIQKARAEALDTFNELCSALAIGESDKLTEIELLRHAKVLLENNGFTIGQARPELRDEKVVGTDRATENQKWFDFEFSEHPMWDDLIDWDSHCKTLEAESVARRDPYFYRPPLPAELKVLDAAYRLATRKPDRDTLFLWQEFWPTYVKDNNVDLSNNYGRQKQRQWFSFLEHVQSQEVNSSAMNNGLRDWLDKRRKDSVSDQTIDKEFRHIKAVLNFVIDQQNLEQLTLRPPKFKIQTKPKVRQVFADDDLVGLFNYCSDRTKATFKPWKAFLLTVMCQSSAHQKELEQLKRSDVHLDDEYPFVNIRPDADVKSKDRIRIIPVPYRTELLKALIDEMDEGQETVLPARVLATDITNRNTQLRRIVAKFGDYQPYCTRHTFKHHLSLTQGTPMQIQYLQGWSGVKQNERQRFEQYGQAAYANRAKHPEVFKDLYEICKRAMALLDDSNHGNVVLLYKS